MRPFAYEKPGSLGDVTAALARQGAAPIAGGTTLLDLMKLDVLAPGRLEAVTWFYSSSSISDEVCHIFLALDVTLDQETDREPGEHIEPLLMPVAEALALVRRGEMKTGTCALAILHCEERLRQAGLI